jgi:hypothetical protein
VELPLTRKQYGALGRFAPNSPLHSQHHSNAVQRLDWSRTVVRSQITLTCTASDGHERVPLFLKLRPPLKVMLGRAVNQRELLSGSERLAVLSAAILINLWSLPSRPGSLSRGSRSAANPSLSLGPFNA